MEFIGIQWAELVKILLNYYAEKTSFVASLLSAFQSKMNNRERVGQLFRVFHNRLRTQLQSALRKSALQTETQKEMVDFLTLVGLIRRLPPRIVNNYLRQNGTPTIDDLLEYCERSSIVAEENEGRDGPRTKNIYESENSENEFEDGKIDKHQRRKENLRIKPNEEDKDNNTKGRCYNCQEYGHLASQCTEN